MPNNLKETAIQGIHNGLQADIAAASRKLSRSVEGAQTQDDVAGAYALAEAETTMAFEVADSMYKIVCRVFDAGKYAPETN